MQKTLKKLSDVADFYKREIVATRVAVDKARRDVWRGALDISRLQEQPKFNVRGKIK